jgi:hypothetical protein
VETTLLALLERIFVSDIALSEEVVQRIKFAFFIRLTEIFVDEML